jgi:hypothetical protein
VATGLRATRFAGCEARARAQSPVPPSAGSCNMSAAVDIVVQINSAWRLVLLHNQATWKRRAWMVQNIVDGVWCDHFQTRSAEMLRWMIGGKAVGRLDASVAEILAALPPRVDIGQNLEPETGSRAGVVYRNRIFKTPAAPEAKIPAMASRDCVTCGSTFTYAAQASRTLTCSPKCSQANQHARRRDNVARQKATAAPPPPEVPAPPPPEAMERAPRTSAAIAAYFWEHHRVRLPATTD